MLQPYHTNYMTADSAGSATAYLCGVKTKLKVIGVNEYAEYDSCDGIKENSINSILTLASQQGSYFHHIYVALVIIV